MVAFYDGKTETLLYHKNLSDSAVAQMKETRRRFIELGGYIESLGVSRELSTAFTYLETALMYAIKHSCTSDKQAELERL